MKLKKYPTFSIPNSNFEKVSNLSDTLHIMSLNGKYSILASGLVGIKKAYSFKHSYLCQKITVWKKKFNQKHSLRKFR